MVIPHQNSSCRTKNPSLNLSVSHLYKCKTFVRLRFLWTLGCADLPNSDTHFYYSKHKDHLLMFFMSSGVKVLANIPIQPQATVLIACLIAPRWKAGEQYQLIITLCLEGLLQKSDCVSSFVSDDVGPHHTVFTRSNGLF